MHYIWDNDESTDGKASIAISNIFVYFIKTLSV